MGNPLNLNSHLTEWADGKRNRISVAQTIETLADASIAISKLVSRGSLAGIFDQYSGNNADGDSQKKLDIIAHDIIIDMLRQSPVAMVGSEESEDCIHLHKDAPLALAIDPLDGSSNVETNLSVGTIFSILPARDADDKPIKDPILQPGNRQLAAGFIIYGPQTMLIFTVRQGTVIFTLDPDTGQYILTNDNARIPDGNCEFAINTSNYHQWEAPVRAYIDDCISADSASTSYRFNMLWVASLVAEAYRIIVRGGVFLYPRDSRTGYQNGRLRLVYEANPIGLLIEQAGGIVTDGTQCILDIKPSSLHERVPLIFGCGEIVDRIIDFHVDRNTMISRSPLFAPRGLFRS